MKYQWISKTWLVSVAIKSKEKTFNFPFNPVSFYFILSLVQSFEILPKRRAYGFASEFLALN